MNNRTFFEKFRKTKKMKSKFLFKTSKSFDIRKQRFIPSISMTSKVYLDKRLKQKSRRFLNDPKNWE